ncbi:MAG: hypothetical protein M3Y03_04775 [Verrucomicrobiota bacterium]|nr:hypothetical protein [Verrucomicrobiota bacterium]
MPQPNMKKQYRAELRELNTHERALRREMQKIHREFLSTSKKMLATRGRTMRGLNNQTVRIAKRRQILEGRLS